MEKIYLDLIDRKILSELDKNSKVPASVLAKRVGRSREAVNYRIQQLRHQGVLRQCFAFINPTKLGYFIFKAYLKLENIPNEREKLFDTLKKSPDVFWIGVSDGAFDIVIAVVAKSVVAYYEKINQLLSNWNHLIIAKVVGVNADAQQYHKKFLLNENESDSVQWGGEVTTYPLDKIDSAILSILSHDSRTSLTQLAQQTDSTVEIIRYKIKKLEENGVIMSYRIDIDINKLGLEFFKALIYFRSLSKKDEETLMEWTRIQPNAIYYIKSLAPWDVEAEFIVESYHQFNDIINKLRKDFANVIKNYEHLLIIDEIWLPAYNMFSPTKKELVKKWD